MNLHIIGSMAPQVKKAFKFFKDKQINSVYMFTPAGRLALLESKE